MSHILPPTTAKASRFSLAKLAVMLLVSLALTVVGVATAGSSPASATPSSVRTATTYRYTIYEYKVCNEQGHFGASTSNPLNPFALYCYDLSIPIGFTVAGGLDMQGYCSNHYEGSKAVVQYPKKGIGAWECQLTK